MQYVQQKVMYCDNCKKDTIHIRNATKPNYLLHLLLIIITAGLWIPFFIISLIGGISITSEPWRCSVCGQKNRSKIEKFIIFVMRYIGIGVVIIIGWLTIIGIEGQIIEPMFKTHKDVAGVLFLVMAIIATLAYIYVIYNTIKWVIRKKAKK